MKLVPDLRAVLFDLDGTLVDSLADIAACMNRVLAERGHPTHELPAYKQFVGAGVPTLCRRALGDAAGEAAYLDEVVAHMRRVYSEHQLDQTAPYPGITDVLGELSQRGVAIAVLSNKPHPNTVVVVEHYFGKGTFQAILGHVAGSPPKPDPSGARSVLADLGVDPTQAAMVGDTDIDMHTAKAAGLAAVGCAWGFRGEAELIAAGADTIAAAPLELAHIL